MLAGGILLRTVATQCSRGQVSPTLMGFYQILLQRSARNAGLFRSFADDRSAVPSGALQDGRRSADTAWISEDLLAGPRTGSGDSSRVRNPSALSSATRREERKQSFNTGQEVEQRIKKGKKILTEGDDVVFGTNPVLLALRQKRRRFFRLFVTEAKFLSQEPNVKEIIQLCQRLEIPLTLKESAQLSGISSQRPHQGVCLDATSLPPCFLDVASFRTEIRNRQKKEALLWLFLDSVMDPMNFGAILRSAYFFGVEKVFTFNGCPLTSTVSKASAGIMEILPICTVDDSRQLRDFFTTLKEGKWSVVGTCSQNELAVVSGETKKSTLDSFDGRGNLLLVLGNENEGVNGEISRFCDQMVSVEAGKKDLLEDANCLNVSVAAGVILSHIAMKRKPPQST